MQEMHGTYINSEGLVKWIYYMEKKLLGLTQSLEKGLRN